MTSHIQSDLRTLTNKAHSHNCSHTQSKIILKDKISNFIFISVSCRSKVSNEKKNKKIDQRRSFFTSFCSQSVTCANKTWKIIETLVSHKYIDGSITRGFFLFIQIDIKSNNNNSNKKYLRKKMSNFSVFFFFNF